MAGTTGLEPATSAVTGQRSSRLNYVPASCGMKRTLPGPTRDCLVASPTLESIAQGRLAYKNLATDARLKSLDCFDFSCRESAILKQKRGRQDTAGRVQRFTREQNLPASASVEASTTMKTAANRSAHYRVCRSKATPRHRRSTPNKCRPSPKDCRAAHAKAWPKHRPTYETMEPGARANEYATHEPVRSIIAVRRTGIRIIRVVAVGANRGWADANPDSHSNAHLSTSSPCHDAS
jgi:hypothetical protein